MSRGFHMGGTGGASSPNILYLLKDGIQNSKIPLDLSGSYKSSAPYTALGSGAITQVTGGYSLTRPSRLQCVAITTQSAIDFTEYSKLISIVNGERFEADVSSLSGLNYPMIGFDADSNPRWYQQTLVASQKQYYWTYKVAPTSGGSTVYNVSTYIVTDIWLEK